MNPRVVILSGGPNSVHVEGSPRVPDGFFEWAAENKVAVLGVCYGMQVRRRLSLSLCSGSRPLSAAPHPVGELHHCTSTPRIG